MATRPACRPLLKLGAVRVAPSSFNALSQRTLTTASRRQAKPQLQLTCALIKPPFPRSTFQNSFRRSYADIVAPKPKRRIRTTFRWLWRLTYLSAIGGIVYMGYQIYQLRTPEEQIEADPNKKTLVVLGIYSSIGNPGVLSLIDSRYGVGIHFTAEKARY